MRSGSFYDPLLCVRQVKSNSDEDCRPNCLGSRQERLHGKQRWLLMYRSFPKPPIPPPRAQTPGHLPFVKNFDQIPRYVASLDGQMPHPLELQRGSNRLFKCTYSVINNWLLFRLIPLETSSAQFSGTLNFLFSLSSLHTLNKGIFHDITIQCNDNNRKNPRGMTRESGACAE